MTTSSGRRPGEATRGATHAATRAGAAGTARGGRCPGSRARTRPRRRRRSTALTLAATSAVTLSISLLSAGCAATPPDPPQISPTVSATAAAAAAHHQDARITLPVTVGIAFHHPDLTDRTEYEVLFTVQQAMRAMVQAEYSNTGQDVELGEYWSGSGLSAVDTQIKQWVAQKQQPVGMIVLEDTTYTPASGFRGAQVGLCADWSDVVRGEARTHVVGAAVQAKGAKPTYEQLTLARASDHRWRVVSLNLIPDSARCAGQ